MNTAILIIDMLNDFFREGRLAERRTELCKKINKLITWGRSKKIKVIWVRQEFKDDLSDAFLVMRKKHIRKTIKNTEGAQLLPELIKKHGDLEIVKKRYSAFFNTPLDDILTQHEIGQLIICGVNTSACVRMAAIDAYQRDLEVIIARDCVDASDREHHEISLKYLGKEISKVLDSDQIMQ